MLGIAEPVSVFARPDRAIPASPLIDILKQMPMDTAVMRAAELSARKRFLGPQSCHFELEGFEFIFSANAELVLEDGCALITIGVVEDLITGQSR